MGKFFRILFFVIVGIVLVAAIGIWISTPKINEKIEQLITEKLNEAGLHANRITVNLWQRGVEVDSLYYLAPLDTAQTPAHRLSLGTVSIRGLHIFALWKKKQLLVEHITLTDGIIHYNKLFTLPRIDSASNNNADKQSFTLRSIEVKKLTIKNIRATLLNDTVVESSGTLRTLEVKKAAVVFGTDTTYAVESVKAELQQLMQSTEGALHRFSVSKFTYSSDDHRLEVDSFRIIPNYSKTEFGRAAKIQKTRLDILLPRAIIEGINQTRFFTDTTLAIKRITLPDATIHAYRDKRYPFVRDWIMPLPIEGIRRLPFKLKIDSIRVPNINIAYEELSEKGMDGSGTITFDTVNATFVGLSTELKNPDKNAFCTLVAEGKVMNSGALNATFKLPLNNTVNYEATGSVRNMDLTSLNPTLANLTRISIRSGILKDLRFTFSYNDNVSTGELLIQYENLKLDAFKKDTDREVNKVLSAAINTIVKTDKGKAMDLDKRIGLINIERDKKRFVFQLWWKSILDGLQSTFTNNTKDKKDKAEKKADKKSDRKLEKQSKEK